MAFVPSKYQQAIFDRVADPNDSTNLIIEAVAGSGKTTTGVKLFGLLPSKYEDKIFVAFNKHIQMELTSRLPQGAQAVTYHALGFSALRKVFGSIRVNADKVDKLLRSTLPDNRKFIISSTKRLVSACKNMNIHPEVETLRDMAFLYNVDLFDDGANGLEYEIFDAVTWAYEESARITNEIDFDDMIWLPLYLSLPIPQHDFMFVDEAQDTNAAQKELALKACLNGRIIGCGDRFQSIYAFRGADADSMDALTETLQADTLPLSISYRCPKTIVNRVNQEFPEIKFECSETAIDGEVSNINKLQADFKPSDLILCRVNAPLIGEALSLIRRGVPAYVKGRDIGKGLQTIIKKMNTWDVKELTTKLANYLTQESDRLARSEKWGMIQILEDKIETIYAISDGANSVQEINQRCETMFADDGNGVQFSTVHKAKGLESQRVYILHPELMPHPRAKRPTEIQQERNIRYVAITRSLDKLYFVQ